MSARSVRWLTLALLASCGAFAAARVEFTTSIAHFIPSRAEAELVRLSIELVQSPLARRMVLSVQGPGCERVASALGDALREHEEVEWVETGVDDRMLEAIHRLYFDRGIYLASDRPEVEIPSMLAPDTLELTAVRLRERLAQPDAILVARAAPRDPLGLFERILDRIQAFGSPDSFPGGEGEGEEPYAIVQLGLRSSPFDSERQAGLLADIRRELERLDTGKVLTLEQSGVNRFAVDAEQRIRADVSFISTVSVVMVCGLFLLVFRSPVHLVTALLAPLSGFAFALAVSVLRAEPMHGVTFAFGFVLIGVSIDYPIHLMNQHALAPTQAGPAVAVARIRSSLLVSAVTTTLAFASLAFSEFPGLGEMGQFAALGVPVAAAFTLFGLPAFLPFRGVATSSQAALSDGLSAFVDWLEPRRSLCACALIAPAAIVVVGLPMLRWEDDPATLMTVDPELQAEGRRVLRRLGGFDGGRFVVGLAEDPQAALRVNTKIHARLSGLVARGELEGIGSLHSFLWPEELQRANLAAFREVPALDERIDQAFTGAGFTPGGFGAFTAAVESPAARPLLPEDLAESPLARVLGPLVELEGRFAVVTYLRGVQSSTALEAALQGLSDFGSDVHSDVHYIDQKKIMSGVYEAYRRSTVRMVSLGAAVVFVVLLVRYGLRAPAFLALVPPVLGSAATMGLLGLCGVPVNIASAVSLLAVLGMGVDYGIFSVDAARRGEPTGTTLSSLLISCVTSVLVFGVLALASQPVLRAVGLVTGVGVLIALGSSPVVMALARPRARP